MDAAAEASCEEKSASGNGLFFSIRRAEKKDIAAALDLYNYYVLNSACNFQVNPDTLEDSIQWLNEQHEKGLGALVCYKLDNAGVEQQLAGFTCLSAMSAAAGSLVAEGSIYIDNAFAGQGLGQVLADSLLDLARECGLHSILLHAMSDNLASIKLAKKIGFSEVGVLKELGSKFGKLCDVVILQKVL